jgi:hypothetical protein
MKAHVNILVKSMYEQKDYPSRYRWMVHDTINIEELKPLRVLLDLFKMPIKCSCRPHERPSIHSYVEAPVLNDCTTSI